MSRDATSKDAAPETIAASHGIATDAPYGSVAPPLYLTTTYAFEGFEQPRRYAYGRGGNPNRAMLAEALARLEGGAGAVITASGMAAFDLLLGLLEPGDRRQVAEARVAQDGSDPCRSHR